MSKTTTEHNFEIEIKEMMDLIESQKVSIKDAKHLVMRSINLLERYKEIQRSRDNWRKKYWELKEQSTP